MVTLGMASSVSKSQFQLSTRVFLFMKSDSSPIFYYVKVRSLIAVLRVWNSTTRLILSRTEMVLADFSVFRSFLWL